MYMVLEKTLESPLDTKEIQPVHPKGDQSWIFIERTDAEAATPILWLPDAKNWFFGKAPDAGKDRRQEEKGTTKDETVGWHHWLDGHEFKQAPGVGDGQRNLVCCSLWGRKESDTTDWLNWTASLGDVFAESWDVVFMSALPLTLIQMVVVSLFCQRVASQEMFSQIPGTCSREGCQLQTIPIYLFARSFTKY